MAPHADDDDYAHSADLAFDVGSVHSLPDFAEQPDLEDIDEYDYQHTSLDLTVEGGAPSEGSIWLGKGDNPRYPQSAPRPPPRYRRDGKAREVGEGLKEAGDDEAMVAIYRSSNASPAPTQDPVWDAARTIELCVHRLREVRGSSISGTSDRGSPAAPMFLPPKLERRASFDLEPPDMRRQDSMSNGELSRRMSFEGASELAEQARRARAQEAKAKEEAESLRSGLEELAKQSAVWREERHLQEASIEGLQAAHTHALHRAAEYQVTIPLLQAKITSLKTDNHELHSLLARRTEEWQAHAKEQAAQLNLAEAKLAGLARRASDAENRAAASEKVAVRHAVVANEVASKVAGVEERAAKIEAEAKRMQGATAAASLAAATELDTEVVGLARDYKELQWHTAALTERCALQQRELEALREEKYAMRGSPLMREMRELCDASSPSSPSRGGIVASPLAPLQSVPGSPPKLVAVPPAGKAAAGGLPDQGDTDYVAAVAVHKPQAVATVLKVLEGEDWAELDDIDGAPTSPSGAISALRWLVAEESRTEGSVPGYIRNVEARFPTPPASPAMPAIGARGASASPATPVHRAGWDQSSPYERRPHPASTAPSHPRPSDAVLARLGEAELPASPERAPEAQRQSGSLSSAAIRTGRAISSPFSVLVERLSSPTAPAPSPTVPAGTGASAVPPRRSPPLAARAQSFAPGGARRSAAAARDAVLREEVRQQLAKLQAVEEAGRALGDLCLEADALEAVGLEEVLDVFVERAEAADVGDDPLVV